MSTGSRIFNERDFYLTEFRRRSIGFAWPADEAPEAAALTELIVELVANETRVVLFSPRDDILSSGLAGPAVEYPASDFAPNLWRALRVTGVARLAVSAEDFERECARAAVALRLAKIVWIQSDPPVARRSGGGRVSVVDLAHLDPLLEAARDAARKAPVDSHARADPETGSAPALDDFDLGVRGDRWALLESVRDMIRGGVPAVNVCAGKEVAQELLTYAGAGIFFTRDRYAEVRKLSLDDFDPANGLIARGEADGFLMPRDDASRDAVLANAVGLFIEGRYLAGIGAILPYPEERAAELASLYALTRFSGEGVGSQIVQHAIDYARLEGLEYLFSCTTSESVEEFFVRLGFRLVGPDDVPKVKWERYDAERRARVRCLRIDP